MRQLENFEKVSLILSAQAAGDFGDYYLDPKLVAELIYSGHEWALPWEYDFLHEEDHPLDAVVEETVAIYKMFQHLQRSEAEITGEIKDTVHSGFDGNNDTHFGVARVLVDKLQRFEDLKGVNTNSHSSGTLGNYRRMLGRYLPLADTLLKDAQYKLLDIEQIKHVLEN
jgi:uncharacterized protein